MGSSESREREAWGAQQAEGSSPALHSTVGSAFPSAGPDPAAGTELFIVHVPSLGKHLPLRATGWNTMNLFCGPGAGICIFHRPPTAI